jgi:hypothetical protein
MILNVVPITLPASTPPKLGPLRELLKTVSTLRTSIADIVQLRVVVDANHVVQNLIYRTRHPRGATAIEELVKATVIDVFAPRWFDIVTCSPVSVPRERK